MALTDAQLRFFRSEGYLGLSGVIERGAIARWQNDFEQTFGSPFLPATRDELVGHNGDPHHTRLNARRLKNSDLLGEPGMRAIVNQLGAGHFRISDDDLHVRWPRCPISEWTPWGHNDVYTRHGWSPFMLVACVHLYDVAPRGGGPMLWPGSHHHAWRFLLDHPEYIDGSFRHHPEYGRFPERVPDCWDIFQTSAVPVEAAGKAGDVVLWHALTLHNSSRNESDVTRVSRISRFVHDDQSAIQFQTSGSLWRHWGG